MTTKKTKKYVSHRGWLESQQHSDSTYSVTVHSYGVGLTLRDCNRAISWDFGKPNSKRAIAKIKKLKEVVDGLYEYLNDKNAIIPEERF